MNRALYALAALLLLALVSCSSGEDRAATGLDTTPTFSLTDAELSSFEAAPDLNLEAMRGATPLRPSGTPGEMPGSASIDENSKSTSTLSKWRCKSHKRWFCSRCFDWDRCDRCGDRDCKKCNDCNDCKCKKKDNCKPKCKDCGKKNCKKCSKCGDCRCAKKDKCEPKKPKCDRCGEKDCRKCNQCGDCKCKQKDKCKPPPPPPCVCKPAAICNLSERFFVVCDCDDQFGDICYRGKVIFDECPCGDCKKSGYEVVFCRDGQEVGRSTTDKDGWAYFCETRIPVGTYTGTVKYDGFDADLRAVVYAPCNHACAAGKGRLPSINNDRYAIFSYEFHFNGNDLVYGGWFNFLDGDISYVNEDVEWFLQVGNDVHFGGAGGNYYQYANATGGGVGSDYTEIYVWDRGYENKGKLIQGRLRMSWGLGLLPAGDLPTF